MVAYAFNKTFKTFIERLALRVLCFGRNSGRSSLMVPEFREDDQPAHGIPWPAYCSRKCIANVSVHVKYMGIGLWRESFIRKLILFIIRCCTSTYSSTSILYSNTWARMGTIRSS